jgi:hypothetical protein
MRHIASNVELGMSSYDGSQNLYIGYTMDLSPSLWNTPILFRATFLLFNTNT